MVFISFTLESPAYGNYHTTHHAEAVSSIPSCPSPFFLQMPLHADLDVGVSRQGVQVLNREALVKTMKV